VNFVALRMLTGDRAKYLGLIFAIAFCTFLLENQTSIFASILKRTGSQILDVTDADVWVMDGKTEYFEHLPRPTFSSCLGSEFPHRSISALLVEPLSVTIA
jgi:hypothetical protein